MGSNTKQPNTAESELVILDNDEDFIKKVAIESLRNGDFNFALKAIQDGESSLSKIVEDLKIYQAELEIQNEELRESQLNAEVAVRRFSNLFAALPIPALVIDSMGIVHECNEMATQSFKLERKQFRSQYFPRMVKKQDHNRLRKLIDEAKDLGQAMLCNIALESAEDADFIADLYMALLPEKVENESRFVITIVDQTERMLTSKRNSALLALTTEAAELSDQDLMQRALEQAETLTNSHIAYAHFVNDDQETISLGVWSANTLHKCNAVHDNHYPISKAGIWADAFRQKKPVIHNNYEDFSDNHKLPEGHAQLLRHISVPVLDGDKVVMLVGVGNKVDAYNEGDITVLEMVANNTWALLARNRIQRKLTLDAEVFRYSREAVMVTDQDLKIISVNPAFTLISGYSADEVTGQTPSLLKSGKHDASFYEKMWADIVNDGHWQGEIWNRRKNGEIYPQWLGISSVRSTNNVTTEYIAVFMDITEHKQSEDRITYLAHHDPLTGLPNRTLLRDRYEQSVAFAQREGNMVAVLYLDLDHFKNINDSLGHPVGDKLLIEAAARICSCVRDTDTVSRVGGDEFVVLLNDIKLTQSVAEIASKILESIATPFSIDNKILNISCSMGVCIYPDDGKEFDQLLQQADISLYQAKGNGRNGYHFFTDEMNRKVARRINLDNELRNALSLNQIYLEYQPQFDITSNQIIGAEALLRWHHPVLGIIPPSEFIPVAEENGFILELGHYVLLQACYQAKKWIDCGYDLRIAVNVSYAQFVHNNLHELVMHALHETALLPHHLELELTESILAADSNMVLTVVQALNEVGVLFSIDDFGTGYSSLSYLKRFAVGKLKIDQSFVRDVPGDSEDEVIVSAIIGLAHNLQLKCIAEGVETIEQAEYLQKMGCDQLQGYLHGKPMSSEKLDELLSKQIVR